MESDGQQPPSRRDENSGSGGGDSHRGQFRSINERATTIPREPPRCLPPGRDPFVNQEFAITLVNNVAASDGGTSAPVVVVTGLPGSGTSAFAFYWGHCFGENLYPDGTLYANLRKDQADGGTSLSAVLGELLTQCGVYDVPTDFGSRQQRYWSVTRNRRLLVVLDHVAEATEIAALRPTSADSLVIATSDVAIEDDAEHVRLPIEPLEPSAARELVSQLIGTERAAAAKTVIDELIELCGGIPKALCVAASRMCLLSNMPPATVVAEIRAELSGKRAPSRRKSIMDAVASRPYQSLSPEAARVYRGLGWHPGLDFSSEAIVAFAEVHGGNDVDVIEELRERNLLDVAGPDRFRFVSLIKAHAQSVSRSVDGADAERLAVSTLAEWYVDRARAADHAFIKNRNRAFREGFRSEPFPDDESAREWFDTERHNLLAMQRRCFYFGRYDAVMRLGESMWVMYIGALYLADWLESSELAVRAAVEVDDLAAMVRFRAFHARALMENGRLDDAERELDLARESPMAEGIGPDLRASAIEFTGRLLAHRGRYSEAIEHYYLAREMFAEQTERPDTPKDQREANRRGVALQDHFIGRVHLARDDPAAALESLRRAEAGLVNTDHDRDVAKVRTGIGEALRRMNDFAGAYEILTEVAEFLADKGWFRIEADNWRELAAVEEARGDVEAELECLERLLYLYTESYNPEAAAVRERIAVLAGS